LVFPIFVVISDPTASGCVADFTADVGVALIGSGT
jgi:hypothetical protein